MMKFIDILIDAHNKYWFENYRIHIEAPLCKGRDALSKQHGVLFIAKAGSKLCLRPGPKAGTVGDWGIV